MKITLLTAGLLGVALHSSAETISELNLTADTNLTVPAGTTTDVARVSGGAFKITKGGAGVLRFGFLKNTQAKLKIDEGSVGFYVPPMPSVVTDAVVHVDAECLDPNYVTTENGTNFVLRWTHASGGTVYASKDNTVVAGWRDDPHCPFVNKGYLNGRDVVDFGSLLTANSSADGHYGAAMNWSKNVEAVRDVYAVIGYTEDVRTHAITYPSDQTPSALLSHSYTFGLAHSGHLQTDGRNPPLFWPWQDAPAQGRKGDIYYNNELQPGSATDSAGTKSVPLGMFYLNARLLDPASAGLSSEVANLNAFARDRSTTVFGGQRIAEYVVFTNRLSSADHDAVENHLRAKWFPGTFASVEAAAGTVFVRDTVGGLVVSRTPGSGADLTVTSGSVTVDPTQNVGAWTHLDANELDDFFLSSSAGKTFVKRWPDLETGTHYATPETTVQTWRPNAASNLPFVREDAQNGLKAIDFGMAQTASLVDGSGSAVGYGAAMNFSSGSRNVHEVVFVARDHETTATLCTDYPAAASSSAAPFVGGDSDTYCFFRHAFSYGSPTPLLLNPWQTATSRCTGYANGIALDGGTPKSGGVLYPQGFHLCNLRANDWMYVSGLARYATSTYGGIVMGECYVFERELDDDVRQPLVKTLLTKWGLGDQDPMLYAYRNITIGGGALVRVPYADLSASDELVLGGTVVAHAVAAPSIRVTSPEACVCGTLDLSETTSVAFDFDLPRGDVEVRVVAADAVVAPASAVVFTGRPLADYRAQVRADGIYLLPRKGLAVIVR